MVPSGGLEFASIYLDPRLMSKVHHEDALF